MRQSSRPSWLTTSPQEEPERDANEVPTLTPLWNGSSSLTHFSERTPTTQDGYVLAGSQSARLPGFTNVPNAFALATETTNAFFGDTTSTSAEMDRDDSALFDVAGRSRRHTRTSSGLSFHGGLPDSAVFSPLQRDHSELFHGSPHTLPSSLTARRSPAGGRSPNRPRALLRRPPSSVHLASPAACSLSLPSQTPLDLSHAMRGLKLRSQASSEVGTPVTHSLTPAPFNADAVPGAGRREVGADVDGDAPPLWTESDLPTDMDMTSSDADRFLSLGWHRQEQTLIERQRAREALRRRRAIMREVLFYLFIMCSFCCFLFSWMMHHRHISFIIPAYRRGWVPAQKSSALFRSGLYYLLLALVCRFDTAWMSLAWLVDRCCTHTRTGLDKFQRRACRVACPSAARAMWSRGWNRWSRLCRHPWSRGGTDTMRKMDSTSRREAAASIRRVAPTPRLAGAHARTAHAEADGNVAAQLKRRWHSLASALRALPGGLRRVWSWASDHGTSLSPSSGPPRRRWTPQEDTTETTVLI